MSLSQEVNELIGIIKSVGTPIVRGVTSCCDEVYPNIFIGDHTAATNTDLLSSLGITHVVNTAEGASPPTMMVNTGPGFYKDTKIKYLGFSVVDLPDSNIRAHFDKAVNFIEAAVRGGGKVLVHCMWGVSRSATCVMAYLMVKKKMAATEALRRVLKRRPCVRPNDGFLQQLVDLQRGVAGQGIGGITDQQFDCVCFYVESPGRQDYVMDECSDCTRTPRLAAIQGGSRAKQPPSSNSTVASGPFSQPYNCSDEPVIPFPKPPPSVELRSGVLISGCQCVKRDGLQHDCPRTGCQGRAPCMAFPAPICVPSGNAQFIVPEKGHGRRQDQESRGGSSPGYGQYRGGRDVPSREKYPTYDNPQNEKYVRLARQGYVENPPAKEKRVTCREHRKIRT